MVYHLTFRRWSHTPRSRVAACWVVHSTRPLRASAMRGGRWSSLSTSGRRTRPAHARNEFHGVAHERAASPLSTSHTQQCDCQRRTQRMTEFQHPVARNSTSHMMRRHAPRQRMQEFSDQSVEFQFEAERRGHALQYLPAHTCTGVIMSLTPHSLATAGCAHQYSSNRWVCKYAAWQENVA